MRFFFTILITILGITHIAVATPPSLPPTTMLDLPKDGLVCKIGERCIVPFKITWANIPEPSLPNQLELEYLQVRPYIHHVSKPDLNSVSIAGTSVRDVTDHIKDLPQPFYTPRVPVFFHESQLSETAQKYLRGVTKEVNLTVPLDDRKFRVPLQFSKPGEYVITLHFKPYITGNWFWTEENDLDTPAGVLAIVTEDGNVFLDANLSAILSRDYAAGENEALIDELFNKALSSAQGLGSKTTIGALEDCDHSQAFKEAVEKGETFDYATAHEQCDKAHTRWEINKDMYPFLLTFDFYEIPFNERTSKEDFLKVIQGK